MISTIKPKKIQIYVNKSRKTIAQIKAETGCDYIINGGLFEWSWKACPWLRVDGKTLAGANYNAWGYGWNGNGMDITMTNKTEAYDNFISCVDLINPWDGVVKKLNYNSDMGGARPRTAIGQLEDGSIVLYCDQSNKTPEQVQKLLADMGCVSALLLDGGGSTQCIFPTGRVYSSRVVYDCLCFWTSEPVGDDKGEESEMTKTEKAIQQMEAWAADNSHGYDQIYRWGQKGDYDCSAAVIQAWENAGVPVKTNGATYTGNMLSVFKKCGFKDVTSSVKLSTGAGLKRGDVLLHTAKHTAMYCGNGYEVEASINEKGTATGGTPGDQTGKEFLKRTYRNYPWQYVLRFDGEETAAAVKTKVNVALEVLRNGDRDGDVKGLQRLLKSLGYYTGSVDGDFGSNTEKAVKAFQRASGLEVDGVVGRDTWTALVKV